MSSQTVTPFCLRASARPWTKALSLREYEMNASAREHLVREFGDWRDDTSGCFE